MPKKDENENIVPQRRNPGAKMLIGEKAKDFKGAVKVLFKELGKFKYLILISIILAIVSTSLQIITPDKLAKLTDEITIGLTVRQDKIEELIAGVKENLVRETVINRCKEALLDTISNENMARVLKSDKLTIFEKTELTTTINSINLDNIEETVEKLASLPDNVKEELFFDSIYEGHEIPKQDKIQLIKLGNAYVKNEIDLSVAFSLPKSLFYIGLKDIVIDDNVITPPDQIEFIRIMQTFDMNNVDIYTLYAKIDELPDPIIDSIKPIMDLAAIRNIMLGILVLYVSSSLFQFIETLLMTEVANRFAKNLRTRISKKINKLPLKYFDKHQSGDILSRVTNDVDTISQSMNQSVATLVANVTLFLGTTFMMFKTNWIMALTAIGSSLIGFVGILLILKKSQKYFLRRQTELGNLNGHIEEVYSGLNIIKLYNGRKETDKKFDELNERVRESNQKSQFLSGMMRPLMEFIGNFGYVAVCVVGAYLTGNNVITFGVIVAFMSYVRMFTSPLSQIAQSLTSIQTAAAASERVFEFINEEEMADESKLKKKLDKKKVKGKIEFKDIIFTYDGNDKPTIKGFSAIAYPGQKVAIVGPTGAGKTTMVNLLMKFYDIDSGDITIDDVSIKDLTRTNIHDLFTMVLQDTWIFDGTIKDNIVYNRKNISKEKLEKICKEVGIDHFVKTSPQGYDTEISEFDGISSGQRQLITIARAMVEESPFLILDEATSNVDTRTEEVVQEAMDKLTKGRTSFIIAHRLSTIKNADLILVVNEGNIIEQGTHNELIEKNGFYADLYNSQFKVS